MKTPLCLCAVTLLLASPWGRAAEPEAVNLISNGGFEMPAGREGKPPDSWEQFTSGKETRIGVTASEKLGGEQGLRMQTLGVRGGTQGNLVRLDVQEGEKYTFIANIKSDKDNPLKGSAEGRLVVEWHDEADREISRAGSSTWGPTLSKLRWVDVSLKKIRAPKGSVTGLFGIHVVDGNANGKGAFLVDDVEILGPAAAPPSAPATP